MPATKHKAIRLYRGGYDYRGWRIEKPRSGMLYWHAGKGNTGFAARTMRRCKEWVDQQEENQQ